MPQWSKEQETAIATGRCNLLVSAAAGSGKTAVLVERIIRLICDPSGGVDVDKLLVVTFTHAAAGEMKERIGLAIRDALKKQPDSSHLYHQSRLLPLAAVTTLHSFCLEVVRNNFLALEMDPNFRIADGTELGLIRQDVLDDLLEDHYLAATETDDFSKLIDDYGGQRDDGLIQNLIFKLYDFSQSNPWPEDWLEKVTKNFSGKVWFEKLLPGIILRLVGAEEQLVTAYQLATGKNGPLAYSVNIEAELATVRDLLAAARHSWQHLYQEMQSVNFAKLKAVKKGAADERLKEKTKELRDEAKETVKSLQVKYFKRSPEELMQDLTNLKPHMTLLCNLVREFAAQYRQAKAEKNLVDFNDLEHFCLQVLLAPESGPEHLLPSEVSLQLREKYAQVLVDEYQDINDVQETILQLVSKDNNLFMVGDVKQSIYGFRLAKPGLFLKKYQHYKDQPNPLGMKIDLSRNFRCRQEIVHGVNFVFQQIMTANLAEMSYNQQAALIYGADYPALENLSLQSPVEVHLLEKKLEESEEVDDLFPLEREARLIGEHIRALMHKGYQVWDKESKEYRKIIYRDIVVLLRSPGSSAAYFTEQLRQLNVPAYADVGSGYFSAPEVQTMIALLKLLDNPRQDIPLAAVLRSPLVGLNESELAMIHLADKEAIFYEAMIKLATDESPLASKIKQFLADLARWRTYARQGNLANLIWTVYLESGYLHYAGAMPGGEQRQANLRALHDRAAQFESTSYRGLFMFLRFLDRLQENREDMEAAKALGENENVVRLMSIHKSKGLEFPVVYVAALGKKFNWSDTYQDVLLHQELGLGPVYIDGEMRVKYPTIAKLAIEDRMKQESLAEEMRVLYVAMTRAREKLVLVGSLDNLSQRIKKWCRFLHHAATQLPEQLLISANGYLDWLGPALIRHEDGAELRCWGGSENEGNLLADPSSWQIQLYPEGNGAVEPPTEETAERLASVAQRKPVKEDPFVQEEIDKIFHWQYPHAYLTGKPAKVTVTEIKHRRQEVDKEIIGVLVESNPLLPAQKEAYRRPVFLMEKQGLTSTEKGAALHKVMRHVELKEHIDLAYVENLIIKLELKELLTFEERKSVDPQRVVNFFQSDLGQRMRRSAQVMREMPFSMGLPAENIYQDLPQGGEQVLLQGVIDCLWYEADGWVLLDYKSDWVTSANLLAVVKRYQVQIELYSQAVEKILHQPVKARYLYFFHCRQGVEV